MSSVDPRVPAREQPVPEGKLAPPPVGFAPLMRHRLLARLSDAVEATPVTLVSGPVGSGKTVLAATWLRAERGRRQIAWLSLDAGDHDPAAFWGGVVAAITRAGVRLPGAPALAVHGPPAGAARRLALALTDLPEPVVLIVDNADHLVRRDLAQAVDLLVRYAGARLRLVLCARADPQLPLHRYRVAGAMTELRTDSLAFDAGETSDLLAALGAPVSDRTAAALSEASGGWAAALRLAAAPLQQGADPDALLGALAADDGGVLWHLFADVLEHQPAAVRRFLLRVSVTAELWPDLLDELTSQPSAGRLLVTLARENAFVEQAAGAPGGHRIHSLFREMLAARLAFESPDVFAELHRTCAAWYARAGDVRTAAQHASAAGDASLAARMLIDGCAVAGLLEHPDDPDEPAQALALGADGRDGAVLRAAAALGRDVPAASTDLTLAALAALDEAARTPLRISAAVVCAAAAGLDAPAVRDVAGALDAAASARQLLAALPVEDAEHRGLATIVAAAEAVALLRSDEADLLILHALRAAVAAGRGNRGGRLLDRCRSALPLLEALQGRLRTASDLVARDEARGDEWGVPSTERSPVTAAAAAWVAAERGDHAGVRRWTDRAQHRTAHVDADAVVALLAVLSSAQRRARGDLDAAEEALRRAPETADVPGWVRRRVTVERVRISLARRQISEGLRRIDALGDDPCAALLRATAAALGLLVPSERRPVDPGNDSPALAVEAGIVRACLSFDAADVHAAVTAGERALRQGEAERMRRPFLEAPPQFRTLVRHDPRLAAAAAWLSPSVPHVPSPRRAADDGAPPAGPAAAPLIPPELSARELDVLRCLGDMLSTDDVAAALFVSVNTVRTHIRSILRKLAVGRRSEAVRRARALGLLEDSRGAAAVAEPELPPSRTATA